MRIDLGQPSNKLIKRKQFTKETIRVNHKKWNTGINSWRRMWHQNPQKSFKEDTPVCVNMAQAVACLPKSMNELIPKVGLLRGVERPSKRCTDAMNFLENESISWKRTHLQGTLKLIYLLAVLKLKYQTKKQSKWKARAWNIRKGRITLKEESSLQYG